MLKKEAIQWLKYFIIILFSAFIGCILMTLAYSLPISSIEHNAKASIDFMKQEGVNPQLLGDSYVSSQIDTYTDAWMIRMAVYNGSENVLEKSLLNKYTGFSEGIADVHDGTIQYLEGRRDGAETYNYARYWHGYMVFLKPLMTLFDYADIIAIYRSVCLALTIFVCLMIVKKQHYIFAIPFVAVLICIDFWTISFSMQYMWVYMVSMIGIMLILTRKKKEDCKYVFLCIGILTSFGDFLTYPLFALGLPLTIYLIERKMKYELNGSYLNKKNYYAIWDTLYNILIWFVGYLGMWLMKWIFASLLTSENIIKDGLDALAFRTGEVTDGSDEIITFMDVIRKNVSCYLKWVDVITVVISVIIIVFIVKKRMKCERENICIVRSNIYDIVSLLIVMLLPFVWFFVSKNHSDNHFWMTFRILGVSIMAGLVLLTVWLIQNKSVSPADINNNKMAR
ncbi:MAG: hypothetical protein MJ133_01120 [Lachnospiraceae bacterium]|nr:hypothetical protein [Lachnospiraceae bacterium]